MREEQPMHDKGGTFPKEDKFAALSGFTASSVLITTLASLELDHHDTEFLVWYLPTRCV
jgi:hypothetical protein